VAGSGRYWPLQHHIRANGVTGYTTPPKRVFAHEDECMLFKVVTVVKPQFFIRNFPIDYHFKLSRKVGGSNACHKERMQYLSPQAAK
jgi:hypothetical protein